MTSAFGPKRTFAYRLDGSTGKRGRVQQSRAMAKANYYHVDPARHRGEIGGRYSENFVKFPFFLKPLIGASNLKTSLTGKPLFLMGSSMVKKFDSVGRLHQRWGTADEIAVNRRNLQSFCKGVDENPYIAPFGRLLIKTILSRNLQNRTETIAFYETNREFIEANGRHRAPLVVTGFFRTGTTLLHRLLSEDPNSRSPYTYELEKSTPPLRSGADPMKDPRIRKSNLAMAALSKLAPGFMDKFAESHLWSVTEKEESLIYMLYHCGQLILNGPHAGREFMHSAFEYDNAPAIFKYERNFFSMLDAYRPAGTHWVLKAPTYAPMFAAIFDSYPDAKVIVTHRNPAKSMASVCRLCESWLVPFDVDGSFDKYGLGEMLCDVFSKFYNRPLEYRRANPGRESQIIDCVYTDLFRDPIGMVRQIYDKFAMEYTQDFEDRMMAYLETNKQGKYGRHRYSNEEYGIDPDVLYEQNRAYFDRYGFGPIPKNDE
jgi:Sulfotransferase family